MIYQEIFLWICSLLDVSSHLQHFSNYCCASPSLAACPNPLPPVNGYIGDYTSNAEGSVVTFYCNEGLAPEGQMNATCDSNGSWTPNPDKVVCTELPPKDKCNAVFMFCCIFQEYIDSFCAPSLQYCYE